MKRNSRGAPPHITATPAFRLKANRLGLAVASAMLLSAGLAVAAEADDKAEAATAAETPAAAKTRNASDSIALSTVTVTAERRETELQKTPATVSVVGSLELERKGVRKINDLAGQAAGVTVTTRTLTPAIFIRGVGSTRPIGNQSVGIYIDDVYIARPFGAGLYGSLPDIDRVEVLNGPQGTLYGKNTGGGAVKLVTREPGETPQGWVSVAAGNQTREGRAYISGGIAPGLLSGSLALAHDETDPDTYNVTLGKKVNGISNQQFRSVLKFTPSDTLKARLSLDGMKSTPSYVLSSVTIPGSGKRKAFSDYVGDQDQEGLGGSLTVEKKLGDQLTLKSITAIRDAKISMPTDSDGSPQNLSGFIQDLDMAQRSQELQLIGDYGRLQFVSGAIFFQEDFDHYRWSWNNNSFSIIDSSVQSTSLGLYGHATYALNDKLSVIGGLRFSRETSELDSAAYGSDQTGAQGALRYEVKNLKESWNAVQPKVGINYQWNPGLLTYASYAVGATAGGYNSAAATQPIAETPVDPDKIQAYEVGVKTTSWNGRLRTSTSLFYNDYEDYQASVNNPIIGGQLVPGAVFANAGKAHTYGAEFSSQVKPTRALELAATISYLKTRFDEYLNPTGNANTNYEGYDLPNSPRLSGSLGATYTIALDNGAEIALNGNYRFEDESYSEVSTNREITKTPAQKYLDLGAFYTTGSGKWTFSLTGKNVLGEDYAFPGSYTPTLGFRNVIWNRERQVSLGVRYDFF